MDYPLFIAVGKKYAFVPEGESVLINFKDGYGEIVGGKYHGVHVKGVTGGAISASFFATMKGMEEVDFKSLLEGKEQWA